MKFVETDQTDRLLLAMLIGLPALIAAFLSFIGVLLTLRNRKGIDTITIQLNGHTEKLLSVQAEHHKIEMAAQKAQHEAEKELYGNLERATGVFMGKLEEHHRRGENYIVSWPPASLMDKKKEEE